MKNRSGIVVFIYLLTELRGNIKIQFLDWLFQSFNEVLFDIRFTFMGKEILIKF